MPIAVQVGDKISNSLLFTYEHAEVRSKGRNDSKDKEAIGSIDFPAPELNKPNRGDSAISHQSQAFDFCCLSGTIQSREMT